VTQAQLVNKSALDLTPNGGVNLSGRWIAYWQPGDGEVVSEVQVQQHGTAVFGTMQCKFAAAHPITIRGILLGKRLLANYWRPHEEGMGSGVLDLRLTEDGRRLDGIGSWHDAEAGSHESLLFRWEKSPEK